MARIAGPFNSGVCAGGAGVSTSNADSGAILSGIVLGVYVRYNDTPPNTTDVTIRTKGTSPRAPTYNLLVLTNANTSGWFWIRGDSSTAAGTVVAGMSDVLFAIDDWLNVLVAQANDADSVDVWVMLE